MSEDKVLKETENHRRAKEIVKSWPKWKREVTLTKKPKYK